MLGIADSSTGQKDWHNILGGVEYLNLIQKILEMRDASSMRYFPISLLPKCSNRMGASFGEDV